MTLPEHPATPGMTDISPEPGPLFLDGYCPADASAPEPGWLEIEDHPRDGDQWQSWPK